MTPRQTELIEEMKTGAVVKKACQYYWTYNPSTHTHKELDPRIVKALVNKKVLRGGPCDPHTGVESFTLCH